MFDSKLYDKLSAYCAYSERCSSDVKAKCRKLNIETNEIPAYILRLQEDGFLDEVRYAKTFIRSKVSRKWGPQKIQTALQAKFIPAETFQPLLSDIAQDDLKEKIVTLANQKRKTIKGKTPSEIHQKLVRFLMGRGFSYTLIKDAIKDNE